MLVSVVECGDISKVCVWGGGGGGGGVGWGVQTLEQSLNLLKL